MFGRKSILLMILLTCLGGSAHAGVNVVGLFRDNMVLQRDREVPVWGMGKAGEKVTVEFQGAVTTTEVERRGQLDPEDRAVPSRGAVRDAPDSGP